MVVYFGKKKKKKVAGYENRARKVMTHDTSELNFFKEFFFYLLSFTTLRIYERCNAIKLNKIRKNSFSFSFGAKKKETKKKSQRNKLEFSKKKNLMILFERYSTFDMLLPKKKKRKSKSKSKNEPYFFFSNFFFLFWLVGFLLFWKNSHLCEYLKCVPCEN